VEIDISGKAPGRGAYLHDRYSCWEAGLRGSLARALRTEIEPKVREDLVAFMNSFSDELHV
jgi:predicted RNA-binding protein YlxR (DUF448 family)